MSHQVDDCSPSSVVYCSTLVLAVVSGCMILLARTPRKLCNASYNHESGFFGCDHILIQSQLNRVTLLTLIFQNTVQRLKPEYCSIMRISMVVEDTSASFRVSGPISCVAMAHPRYCEVIYISRSLKSNIVGPEKLTSLDQSSTITRI